MEDRTTRVSKTPPLANAPCSARNAVLIQIYGPGVGRKVELGTQSVAIGRSVESEVQVECEDISRLHCRISWERDAYSIVDLGSTNGTYVNDVAIEDIRVLCDGDTLRAGDAIFRFLDGGNIEQKYFEEIHRMALVDGLTGIQNRRAFDEYLEREISRCERHAHPLSLLLLDLDYFKRINDELGHLAGDFVLQHLAQLVRDRFVRREDCFARFGGEEFVLVLSDTGIKNARIVAERVREAIAFSAFEFRGTPLEVSVSIGLSIFEPGQSAAEFIDAADGRLYAAKEQGRNRVCG